MLFVVIVYQLFIFFAAVSWDEPLTHPESARHPVGGPSSYLTLKYTHFKAIYTYQVSSGTNCEMIASIVHSSVFTSCQ